MSLFISQDQAYLYTNEFFSSTDWGRQPHLTQGIFLLEVSIIL